MALIVAFVVAVVATPVAARLATRLGVVDQPGPLKVHARPVPYLGGVAVFVGLAGPVAGARPSLLVPLGAGVRVGVRRRRDRPARPWCGSSWRSGSGSRRRG